ncbi:MAG: DegT/DnrJ/EryC1/StrS aminotransferase family protein, partial [Gammaproteobacteria bacterium]
IEDCAQAHGATYRGKSVGSIGHIGTWSFCNDKIMTLGGEGGMITTNIKKYYDFAASFNNHGKNFRKISLQKKDSKLPKFKYVHDSIGSNYRMTEMQAVIGRIQLKRMKEWTLARFNNANEIYKSVAHLSSVNIPSIPKHMTHAFYKCYIMLNKKFLKDGWTRDKIIFEINNKGVNCFSGSCPEIYLEKSYKKKYLNNRLPVSKKLGEDSLMFAVHPNLTKKEVDKTKAAILQVLEEASK